jgi:stage V sporulation protein AC
MNMDKNQYKKFAIAHAPKSPVAKNCVLAFLVGGTICALSQGLTNIYLFIPQIQNDDAKTLASLTLIFIAVLLTGLGVFDKIAKFAGAGTLVPITGFANAVVSPAIDSRSEGMILGVGAKIFAVAGPVLLYGTVAGAVWGVIYWLITII